MLSYSENIIPPRERWLHPGHALECKFMDRPECGDGQIFDAEEIRCVWCPPGTVAALSDRNGTLLTMEMACVEPDWKFTGEVNIGLLHSLTGEMSSSERAVVNAEKMAITEINDAGGSPGQEARGCRQGW